MPLKEKHLKYEGKNGIAQHVKVKLDSQELQDDTLDTLGRSNLYLNNNNNGNITTAKNKTYHFVLHN